MRLVNPDEVRERYNWYVDIMENEPDSALHKALNEADDYNDPQREEIALTMEQWDTVLHWLTYGGDYHRAKVQEWLHNCVDVKTARAKAAEHQKAADVADQVRKIIEETLRPTPKPETE